MSEEYFDILDENGNKTGQTKLRNEVHRDGDWHAAVHIWIINNNREVLLQRRCANKDSHPNMLDISCAGHLSAGDSSLEGAIRELKEELGLEVKPEELEYIKTLKNESKYTSDFINNEFNDLYILKTDKGIEEMKYQEEEISEIFFVPYEKFKEMVENHQPDLLRHEEEFKILFDVLEEERRNKKEEILKKVKDNFGMIEFIIGIIAVFSFNLCSYMYEIGRNLYFKIDNRFLKVDFENNTMIFLAYIFMTILFFVSSYWIYKNTVKEKLIRIKILYYAGGMFLNAFLLDILFNSTSPNEFMIGFIIYLIFAYLGIKVVGKKIYIIIHENAVESKNDVNKIICFFVSIPIIFLVLGHVKTRFERNFDYITLDEQQYVVIDIYNDLYYTYPCEINEGKMTVDSSIRRMFPMDEVVTQKGNFTLEIK